MDFLTALDIGSSALSAERTNLNIISMNLANAKTTRTAEGGPYQRRGVIKATTDVDARFSRVMQDHLTRELKGVRILGISRDSERMKQVFEPGHPDANKDGYVTYPDINVVEEMTNMLTTTRSYEASVASISSVKGMWNKALELGR
ncbi:flagellar basal body rod protein FlgC [Desulfovibrio ferrophilus]|uniref:Flagellar basal-body rod protein FlgC n=1 Tax=Desulfovibrio ferrophilus TaxID=241368 RepID=A0A2Z6B1H7_9BACT|nr:flagellar basal body rod protein FlgC [Desulfovibrio ferrophilus]BBD09344.1 flagellar basal-body rod protein FlgC [Desulfovibrio ferrophilus]